MIAELVYHSVGKRDEIMRSGWKTASIFGREIVVIFHNKEFFAIERGDLSLQWQDTSLPEDRNFSQSGLDCVIDKFITGPDGAERGKLKYLPIKIEDDSVMVGITY